MEKIVVVKAVEVFNCMCGKFDCPYCGKRMSAHNPQPTHCPRCGYPLQSRRIEGQDEQRNAVAGV
jgi:tRNA(Ile2) C34 agmatinyltransferase TiaS